MSTVGREETRKEAHIQSFVQNGGFGSSSADVISVWEGMIKDGSMPSDINVQDSDYYDYTALIYQARSGTKEAMEWLLTRHPPADVNIRSRGGDTAIMYASDDNNPDKVRLLLEYGADRDIPDKSGTTPLKYATKEKKERVIPILEDYFPDVSAAAIQERFNIAVAKIDTSLDAKSENISKFVQTNRNGKNPSGAEVISMWEGMIKDGSMPSDINVQDSECNDYTSLIYQSYYGTKETMEWLLTRQLPANVNLRDRNGNTAIMWATYYNNPDKVRLLIEYGADRDIANSNGETPLQVARNSKNNETLLILDGYFPDVTDTAIHERTAFACAKLKEGCHLLSEIERDRLKRLETDRMERERLAKIEADRLENIADLKAFFKGTCDLPAIKSLKLAESFTYDAKLCTVKNLCKAFSEDGFRFEIGGRFDLDANEVSEIHNILLAKTGGSGASASRSGIDGSPHHNSYSVFSNSHSPIDVSVGGGDANINSSISDSKSRNNIINDIDSSKTIFSSLSSSYNKHHRSILMIPMDSLAVIDEDDCVLGEGSQGRVIKAKLSNVSLRPMDVAVKVYIPKAGAKADDELANILDAVTREVGILLEIEAKVGNHCTERMVHVIGIATGQLPSSFEGEFGRRKKAVALVMRLEAGGTLFDMLKSPRARSLRMVERLHLIQQLSLGLAEIHDVGVVHGDIKTSNIFLSDHTPPLVRLGDFGESTLGNKASLGHSTWRGTARTHGTLLYNAPEMLVTDAIGLYAAPSRKTDVYAFGLVCYEVLCMEHKSPFTGLFTTDAELISTILKGARPNIATDIHADIPLSLQKMIEACWSGDRGDRPSALECFMRVDQCYNVLSSSSYDIFFSHPWTKKAVLRHVKRYLTALGYKVWYDEDDMQWDLVRSMAEGVRKSKVVLACISKAYEKSQNCMLELSEACKLANKTIVTLSTDVNPFSWAGNNKTYGDLKYMCGISGQGKLFFDIGEICDRPGWEEVDEAMIPRKNIDDLHRELDKLVVLLRGSQINCKPSF